MHFSSSKLVLWLGKITGIAPYRIVKNNYVFSLRQYVFNLVFLVIIVGLGLHALFSDYLSTFRSKSVRMKTRTAIVVTFLGIFFSMLVVTSGIINSVNVFAKIERIDAILRDVDDRLGIECNFLKFTTIVCYMLAHDALLVCVDSWYWFHLAPHAWSYVVCYWYIFIEIAIETQFALIAVNIGARFRRINERLSEYFDVENARRKRIFCVTGREYAFGETSKMKQCRRSVALLKRHFVGKWTYGFDFETFQKMHWSLCKCVRSANNCFGWQLLVLLLCNCVHIIVTPYFLLLNLFYPATYGSADLSFLILQIVWIVTHHMHLLLLVIPASDATDQAKRSIVIICGSLQNDILRDELYTTRLETFVWQMKKFPVGFSVCGLFTLKKSVITSLIGSVITYLVILIQFQNSDKVYH